MSLLKKILEAPFETDDYLQYLKEINSISKLEEFFKETQDFYETLKNKYSNKPYRFPDEEIEEDSINAGIIANILNYIADPAYKDYNPLSIEKSLIPIKLSKKMQSLAQALRDLSDDLENYLEPSIKITKIPERTAFEALEEIEKHLEELRNSKLPFDILDQKLLELREKLKNYAPYSIDFLGKDIMEASLEELHQEEIKKHKYSDIYWQLENRLKAFHKEILAKWLESIKPGKRLFEELKLGEFTGNTESLIKKTIRKRILSSNRVQILEDLAEIKEIYSYTRKVLENSKQFTEITKLALFTIASFADMYLMYLREHAKRFPGIDDLLEDFFEEYLNLFHLIVERYGKEKKDFHNADELAKEILLIEFGLNPKLFKPGMSSDELLEWLTQLTPEKLEELRKQYGTEQNNILDEL